MCHDPAACDEAIAYWDALYAAETAEEAQMREAAERAVRERETAMASMSEARLAEIRDHIESAHQVLMADDVARAMQRNYPDLAHDFIVDGDDLLAEVERLRAREAALLAAREQAMAVVERVATMLYIPLLNDLGATTREICGGCARSFQRDDSGWFSEDSRHAPDCVVEQARALLASDSVERSGGDGA